MTCRGQIPTTEFALQHSRRSFFFFFLLYLLGCIYSTLISLLIASPLREKGNGKEHPLLSAHLPHVKPSARHFTYGISCNPVSAAI